jgi:hypothetical protein
MRTLLLLPVLLGLVPAQAAHARQARSDSIPFAETVARLSELGGFFDTDNLISNESGFLHVVPTLLTLDLEGSAYLGVGPDQNYSYIAASRPALALMVDVRRDNLLHHLFLKALFQISADRGEYLSRLTGRPAFGAVEARGPEARGRPGGPEVNRGSSRNLSVDALVGEMDAIRVDPAYIAGTRARLRTLVASYGVPLSPEDLDTVERFHGEFVRQGLDLRFQSFGRAPRAYYPTLRDLVLARDLEGVQRSYLASEEAFQIVRDLQVRGRLIPVVGDLGGDGAMTRIPGFLREQGLEVGAFYTSNVEFYLFPQGTFDRFASSVAALPARDDAVIIRSLFLSSFWGSHPLAVSGFSSVQLLERITDFVDSYQRGAFTSYSSVVTDNVFR